MVVGGGLEGKHRYNSEGNKQSIDMRYEYFELSLVLSWVPRCHIGATEVVWIVGEPGDKLRQQIPEEANVGE